MATQRVCVLLLGDEKQYKDYKIFKGDLEEQAKGNLELEDLRDINNGPENIEENHRKFLVERDAIIVVCSAKMKDIIEGRHVVDIKLSGKYLKLYGSVLNDCFSKDEIKNKVVLVSLYEDEEESDVASRVPAMLSKCHYFNTNNDDVLDQVIGTIIAMRK